MPSRCPSTPPERSASSIWRARPSFPPPLGAIPAELVTFYEDGQLDGVFPLNGHIGFGWTEAEELKLARPFTFSFSFGEVTAKIINVRFYPTGEVKSLTLWSGETVKLTTPAGIFPAREFAVDGGLLSYGTRWSDMYRILGTYAGRMLKGARPIELPVQRPATYELVINMRTARTLGVQIPPLILTRADELIE